MSGLFQMEFGFQGKHDIRLSFHFHKPSHETNTQTMHRAVFHQNGQRGDDWEEGEGKLGWVPRAGSYHYNGEWEWRFGPAALTNVSAPRTDMCIT